MTNMKDIKDKIVEAKKHKNDELSKKDKKSELPKLRSLKKKYLVGVWDIQISSIE